MTTGNVSAVCRLSAIKITSLIFQVKNSTVKLSGLNIFREYTKKLIKLNPILVLGFKSKAL